MVAELFLSHAAVAAVKQYIVCAFVLFIPAMMAAGITGNKMGGGSRHPMIAAKRRRMPLIAANGLLVLLPCAFYLNHSAQAGRFDGVFYTVQAVELLAGAVNLMMMARNIRDGFAIRKPKNRTAR
ncbi:hypothetical protein [Neisseria animalis]|uniref:hypothetical protein n=1 Tax=Neisseria animalis TaxID=492 RepID=UPI000F6F2D86|nr:hypothetical protein [Neisseria animalis]VEE06147.1 Uncharacterised protein [Neisseria animalis]